MPTITREEFLNEYQSSYVSWAAQAEDAHIKEPTEARINSGWVVEQPKHTYFNWHMHRTDSRLQELEAKVAWLEKCLAEQIATCEE